MKLLAWLQLNIGLRHCVQSANKLLIKKNLLIGVEDRGQLSCHKVVVSCFKFFPLTYFSGQKKVTMLVVSTVRNLCQEVI